MSSSITDGKSPHAWLHSHKNCQLTGTYYETAFQLSVIPKTSEEEESDTEDPLRIPLFDQLGYHCIPHIGVYGSDFSPALPLVLLKVPLHLDALPVELSAALQSWTDEVVVDVGDSSARRELPSCVYVMLHSIVAPQPCQHFKCDQWREINVMYHTWAFAGAEFTAELDVQTTLNMGVFSGTGIQPTHQQELSSEVNGGMPFDRLGARLVGIHGRAFSPLNAQILLSDAPIHTFFALATSNTECVVSYHVIPESDRQEELLSQAVAGSDTLKQCLDSIELVDQHFAAAVNVIRTLLLMP
eukprot:TRINITY_DN6125_c0_g1_i2.p1 TRINITY_DN6125_c0_g1~~TRINITY_DN6125_c0_g1_i2.p1  ORF type:complete len:299 (-),score=23.59 TRINITY_DN6125_c0_g1_i2:46-942(-)